MYNYIGLEPRREAMHWQFGEMEFGVEVGDPITLMDLDPAITFVTVIVTFYLLLWIRLLFSFIDTG